MTAGGGDGNDALTTPAMSQPTRARR